MKTYVDPGLDFFEDLKGRTLLDRARKGDTQAFEPLIRKHQCMLYSVALAILGDVDEAQQATRVTLVRSCVRLLASPWDHAFLRGTYQLLVCECLEARKDESRPPNDAPLAGDGAAASVPVRRSPFDEKKDHLRAELRQLDPEDHAIVVLRHLAALSYRETAFTLALTTGAVRARLYKTRQLLCERVLPPRRRLRLSADDEALLQGDIDGVLDPVEREAYDRLVAGHVNARAQVAVIRELAQLLNSLGAVEPPVDLAPRVLAHLAEMTEAFTNGHVPCRSGDISPDSRRAPVS